MGIEQRSKIAAKCIVALEMGMYEVFDNERNEIKTVQKIKHQHQHHQRYHQRQLRRRTTAKYRQSIKKRGPKTISDSTPDLLIYLTPKTNE